MVQHYVQFNLYKQKTSIQQDVHSQEQRFLPGWCGLGTSIKLKDKPSGSKLFWTVDKNNLPMAFPMLHFPEPPKFPMFLFLVEWQETVSQQKYHELKIQPGIPRMISTWKSCPKKPLLSWYILITTKVKKFPINCSPPKLFLARQL